MEKTDYEKGRIDGYCGLEMKYPNNTNYSNGYRVGVAALLRETDDEFIRSYYGGNNDANFDQHYA